MCDQCDLREKRKEESVRSARVKYSQLKKSKNENNFQISGTNTS